MPREGLANGNVEALRAINVVIAQASASNRRFRTKTLCTNTEMAILVARAEFAIFRSRYSPPMSCNLPSSSRYSVQSIQEMSYDPSFEASKALPFMKISRKLEEFAATDEDPMITRFSRSPPSMPSAPTTEYEESAPPSPGEILCDKEMRDLWNSHAKQQFHIQVHDEVERMRAAKDKGILQQPPWPHIFDFNIAAESNVRYRWIQQGMWDKCWDIQLDPTWKHEWRNSQKLLFLPQGRRTPRMKIAGTTRKRKAGDAESDCPEDVKSASKVHNQQMSRPCYQFVHQFCEEREWIKMGLSTQNPNPSTSLDATAYENVKARWIEQGIWDDDWTYIPGIWWRHERPRKYPNKENHHREENASKAARIEEAERPPKWYPMAPERPLVPAPDLPCPEGFYRGISGNLIPKTAASASTSARSEDEANHSSPTPQVQQTPDPPAKKSTSNGTKSVLAGERSLKKKTRPRETRKAAFKVLTNNQNNAINKGKNRNSFQTPKQRKANKVTSSRPRRAATVAAMEKMAKGKISGSRRAALA